MLSDKENPGTNPLSAIADGFNQRITAGVIPTFDGIRISSDPVEPSEIITDKKLRLKLLAISRLGVIESVRVTFEDFGEDEELKRIIAEKHGEHSFDTYKSMDVMLSGVRNIGETRAVDPDYRGGPFTHTRTYALVYPEVTQAVLDRIPTQ